MYLLPSFVLQYTEDKHCDFKQWILNRSLELPSLVKSMHAQTDLGIQATPYKLETKNASEITISNGQ